MALKDLVASDGWDVYKEVVEEMAEHRARAMLKTTTADGANFDRGVLFGYRDLYDVVERIILKAEERDSHARLRDDDDAVSDDYARFWGNPNYAAFWRH